MSAQVLAINPAVSSKAVSSSKQDDVLIHVCFHPNHDVSTIDKRPAHLSPKQWLGYLWTAVPGCYFGQTGGRAFFRIPQETFDTLLSKA